jgi:AmmeMemoRadiSam system protein B
VVAGTFYPADDAELTALVDRCLKGAPATATRWPAVMVPHAGLIYSGALAARTFASVQIPSRVLILCPKHTAAGVDLAAAPHSVWQIPGAEIAGDAELTAALVDGIEGLQLDSAAHAAEHAIEVELPFLARLAPRSRVAAIAVGTLDLAQCLTIGRQLADVIRRLPEPPLLVISSDMNHFANDADNRRLDEMALQAIESFDPERLFQIVQQHRISMCGVRPAVIVMQALRELGQLGRVTRTGYATSGDVTGDRSRVVGYAGALLGPA